MDGPQCARNQLLLALINQQPGRLRVCSNVVQKCCAPMSVLLKWEDGRTWAFHILPICHSFGATPTAAQERVPHWCTDSRLLVWRPCSGHSWWLGRPPPLTVGHSAAFAGRHTSGRTCPM